MKIFLAGATGVIGLRLLPLLVDRGHVVAGMTRTRAKAELVQRTGAEPVICDVYDRADLLEQVAAFQPEMVIHQLTDLPDSAAELADAAHRNSRMRREGTRNLIDAAAAAGATRLLAQSIAWEPAGDGALARAALEDAVLNFGGVVVRYGQLYGPGTFYEEELPGRPRIQVDAAARRTIELLELSHTTVTIAE